MSEFYKSIHRLPFSRFIDCIVNDNLSALTIKGSPAIDELSEAWQNILQEYAEAIGNNEYRVYILMFKEITLLQLNYDTIQILIEILQRAYSKELCNELNMLLCTSFDFEEKYHDELIRCKNRSMALKLQIDLKTFHFEIIEKKNKNHKYNLAYFQSILITLSDHAKYQINDSITVFEYCERIKRLNQYYESKNFKSWQKN